MAHCEEVSAEAKWKNIMDEHVTARVRMKQ